MERWISCDTLPIWAGFAWIGRLKLRNIKTGKTIKVNASGVYFDNGRNVKFKVENWDWKNDINDYEVTHYITHPDSIPNLFNTYTNIYDNK